METTILNFDNKELLNSLEKLHYEVQTRQKVITFMLENGKIKDNDLFETYHNDYINKTIEYDKLKKTVNEYYNLSRFGSNATWTVDFKNEQLIIEKK